MAKAGDEMAQLVGARLRACREVAGLSQRALARRMGCLSHREVGWVERGHSAMGRTPGLLAAVFGIPEAQLRDPDEGRWHAVFEAWHAEWARREQRAQLEARKAALLRELVALVQREAELAVAVGE